MIAVIEQPHVIRRILAHLKQGQGLQRAPPPRLFPQKLQHFLAELSPQRAQAVRASDDSLFWDEVPDWPHPRYTISTLWIPFDFPIHLISAPFGLLSGVSTLFPRTQSKRKVLLIYSPNASGHRGTEPLRTVFTVLVTGKP